MRLFSKIALTLSLTAIGSSLAAIATVSIVFLPQYDDMDRNASVDAAMRVHGTLQRELDVAQSRSGDWGNWDDTLKFAHDLNKNYVEANLNTDALQTINVNEYIIATLSGEIIAYHNADDAAADIPKPFAHAKELPKQIWPALNQFAPRKRFAGIVNTPTGPLMVALTQITDSKYEKPGNRVLVLTRVLDKSFFKMVEEQSGTKFTLKKPLNSQFPNATKFSPGVHARVPAAVTKQVDKYNVQMPLFGPAGTTSYVLEIETPLVFSELASETITYVAAILLLIGLATGYALVVFMRHSVTAPIEHIITHTKRISRTANLDGQLGLNRNDEIGELASAYDQMIVQLKHARIQIQEMSYSSGMANTAADMLHNIRNALGPITTAIWKGREALKDFKTARLVQAGNELSNPAIENERRTKLASFVVASANHVDDRGRAVTAELETIQDFSSQIENVLSHNEALSRGARVSEPVMLGDMIETARKIVKNTTQLPVQIKVVGDLMKIPPVLAQRVVLRQIVENVVVNAIQSLEAQNPATPIITFAAESSDNRVELSISDNGAGIEQSNIQNIFSRGVSTKGKPGRGLGLHFCATSVRAMHGEISANSDGAGKGATFKIELPKSTNPEAAA